MNGTNGWTGCAETEPHRPSQTTAATLWYFMGNPISPGHLLQRFGPSAEARIGAGSAASVAGERKGWLSLNYHCSGYSPSRRKGLHSAGFMIETAGGVFQVRQDEPAPRVGAGLHRTP